MIKKTFRRLFSKTNAVLFLCGLGVLAAAVSVWAIGPMQAGSQSTAAEQGLTNNVTTNSNRASNSDNNLGSGMGGFQQSAPSNFQGSMPPSTGSQSSPDNPIEQPIYYPPSPCGVCRPLGTSNQLMCPQAMCSCGNYPAGSNIACLTE